MKECECKEPICLWPLFWAFFVAMWFLTLWTKMEYEHDLELQKSINKSNVKQLAGEG